MPPLIIQCPRCRRTVALKAGVRIGQIICPHCGHRWIPRRGQILSGKSQANLGTSTRHAAAPQAGPLAVNTPPASPPTPAPPPAPPPTRPPASKPPPASAAASGGAAAEQPATSSQSQAKAPRSRARMRVKDLLQEEEQTAARPASISAPVESSAGLGLLDNLAALDAPRVPTPPPASPQLAEPRGSKTDSQRLWPSQRDPLIGREMRGLRIERKLGEGGMGSVYEATQLSLERRVALKILSPKLRGNKDFISKLETEAKILARVNHPNILHVYDFGEDPEIAIYYMAMEFVDGSDLTTMLQRRGCLGQIEALEIIRQAALGLDAAAQNGIIHRDVKPDNLMLTKEGVCKVSDFGLATDLNISDTEDPSASRKRVGTPAFMSPEQCQGGLLDVRSDIYSLGCTAFVALVGAFPFEAESPFEVMLQHRTVPPPSLRRYHREIEPEVEALVHRMMAKRPNERFVSMAELAQALKRVIDRLFDRPSAGSAPATQEIGLADLPDWMSQ